MQEFIIPVEKVKLSDTFSFNDGANEITGRYIRDKETPNVVKVQLLIEDDDNEATGKMINNEVNVDIGFKTIILQFI